MTIAPCACGGEAQLWEGRFGKMRYVRCEQPTCWRGPYDADESKAIAAWNRLMGAV